MEKREHRNGSFKKIVMDLFFRLLQGNGLY